jgi:DNA-binding FadR family transcriptional regulator
MRQVENSRSNVVQAAIRNVQASRRRLSPITDEIGAMIVAGDLKEGESLSERMFGGMRSVSRTSFREAIKVLEGKGLVRARQNTGTLVAPRSDWHLLDPEILAWRIGSGDIEQFIQDFFAFRRSIEPPAAEAAAGFQDKVRIAEMRRAYEDMCALEASKPFGDEYVDADVRFHQAVFRASGNEFLMAMGYILHVPLTLSFTLHSTLHVGPTNRLTLHNDVLTAIETGDAPAARTASLALLSDVAHDVGRIVDALE